MKKKCLAMLLAVVMMVSLLPGTARAAETSGKCGENVTWSFSDGVLTIQGTGPMEKYSGGDWEDEGDRRPPWFDFREQIHTVKIGDGVTAIGRAAFYDCVNLTGVSIPGSVFFLGKAAFYGCGSLTGITIPDSVTYTEDYVFGKCGLTSVTLPDSISLGRYAFIDCADLTGVTIPGNIGFIGAWTFARCGLTSVTLSDGVAVIGAHAFDGCGSLAEITIPESITTIQVRAFESCASLTDVCYGGSESQWERITVDNYRNGNDTLLNANIRCIGTTPAPEPPKPPPLPTITLDPPPNGASVLTETAEYRLRSFTVETKEIPYEDYAYTYDIYTYSGEPSAETLTVTCLPMGTNIRVNGMDPKTETAGYGWFNLDLTAWSDPDGDGVYEERIFYRQPNVPSGRDDYSPLPLGDGPYDESSVRHGETTAYGLATTADADGVGFNSISRDSWFASSYKLFQHFGPNTLIRLTAWYAGYDEDNKYFTTEPETLACLLIPGEDEAAFTDVPGWCASAANWAANMGIAAGVGGNKFAPNDICKNTEILTFLWRAEKKPAAKAPSPFTVDSWCQGAVDWAYEEGLIDDSFDPGAPCTRASALKYMCQASGGWSVTTGIRFTDVPADADYAGAVAWALYYGITNGYPDNTFRPGNTCSRGEIATFLHRSYDIWARL